MGTEKGSFDGRTLEATLKDDGRTLNSSYAMMGMPQPDKRSAGKNE